jgi:hypothetical protein
VVCVAQDDAVEVYTPQMQLRRVLCRKLFASHSDALAFTIDRDHALSFSFHTPDDGIGKVLDVCINTSVVVVLDERYDGHDRFYYRYRTGPRHVRPCKRLWCLSRQASRVPARFQAQWLQ